MTNLQRHVDEATRAEWTQRRRLGDLRLKTPEQGAATSVLLATSPLLDGVSGRYFEDCNEARTVPRATRPVTASASTRSIPTPPDGSGRCRYMFEAPVRQAV